jgi:hypothetical protein
MTVGVVVVVVGAVVVVTGAVVDVVDGVVVVVGAVVVVTGAVVDVVGASVVEVVVGATVVEVVGAAVVVVVAAVVVVTLGDKHVGTDTVLSSRVTAPLRARTRPLTLAPVFNVMDVRANTEPLNWLVVPSVAELPTCQNTLQA